MKNTLKAPKPITPKQIEKAIDGFNKYPLTKIQKRLIEYLRGNTHELEDFFSYTQFHMGCHR